MNKVRLWVRGINVGTYNSSGNNRSWSRVYHDLSRNATLSFFSRIPIVSFYPNTLRAIGKLKALPDIEQTISGILYTSTLRKGDACFRSISKIIRAVYWTAYTVSSVDFRMNASEYF